MNGEGTDDQGPMGAGLWEHRGVVALIIGAVGFTLSAALVIPATESGGAGSLTERAERAAESLEESAGLLDDLQVELEQRREALDLLAEELQVQEALAQLSEEEAAAVSKVLSESGGGTDWTAGIVLALLSALFGALLGWAVPRLQWRWYKRADRRSKAES